MAVRVLVTGASSGVGAAASRLFASKGAALFLCGRDAGRLNETREQALLAGCASASVGVGDTSNESDVSRMMSAAVAALGGVDVAILNAGVGHHGPMHQVSIAHFDETMAVNLRGVFLWSRLLVPLMLSHARGQLIVTSSVLGLDTRPTRSVYCASKYAVQGLIGGLRGDLKGTGVKAATVCPAGIDTPWWEKLNESRPKQPGALLTADEVAAAMYEIAVQPEASDIESITLRPGVAPVVK